MSSTPSFRGKRALVLHRPGVTTERLVRQLSLLGLIAEQLWHPLDSSMGADLLLVDADEGWNGLLPWTAATRPMPLVALLASEAPGRITWALDQGAEALITKPVAASAVYPALLMATRRHAEARAMAETVAVLQERVRLRPLVLAAVKQLQAAHGWDEDTAFRHLRREAMRQRLALEQCAAAVLAEDQPRRA